MDRLTLWLARRREMRRRDDTVHHGLEADDRVRTPDGPGTVWMADPMMSWEIVVELDEPVGVFRPDRRGRWVNNSWVVPYNVGDVEALYCWDEHGMDRESFEALPRDEQIGLMKQLMAEEEARRMK